MHTGPAVPRVTSDTPMPDVIHEMSDKRLGMTCVVDSDGRLVGVVTDGDLRRNMTRGSNLLERRAGDVMTAGPVTIAGDMLGVEALRVMEDRKITSVVVVAPDRSVQGVVHLHDLWRTQMI
jgi:arabinose-5-phosphate isomerase